MHFNGFTVNQYGDGGIVLYMTDYGRSIKFMHLDRGGGSSKQTLT